MGLPTSADEVHIEQCHYCKTRVAQARAVEQRLLAKLNRWSCPPSQQLGEYHLGLISQAAEQHIMRHLEECALCKDEVETLRQFLSPVPVKAKQPELMPVSPKRRQRFGEVIAQLLPQTGAPAMRGSHDGPMVAEADGTSIIVDVQETTNEQVLIVGQVAADDQERWTGALVELRQSGQLIGTARVNDLGGWQFGPVVATVTELRITPRDGDAMVLPELPLTH